MRRLAPAQVQQAPAKQLSSTLLCTLPSARILLLCSLASFCWVWFFSVPILEIGWEERVRNDLTQFSVQ